jgi:hypothetical protein
LQLSQSGIRWRTKSIRSIYADYGTQRQEVAIPPQHGRDTQEKLVEAGSMIPNPGRVRSRNDMGGLLGATGPRVESIETGSR